MSCCPPSGLPFQIFGVGWLCPQIRNYITGTEVLNHAETDLTLIRVIWYMNRWIKTITSSLSFTSLNIFLKIWGERRSELLKLFKKTKVFSILSYSTKLCFQCSHCRRRALLPATTTLRAEPQKASLPASSPQYHDFTVCSQWVSVLPRWVYNITIKWLHKVLLVRVPFLSCIAGYTIAQLLVLILVLSVNSYFQNYAN